jgi:hypothetical protein
MAPKKNKPGDDESEIEAGGVEEHKTSAGEASGVLTRMLLSTDLPRLASIKIPAVISFLARYENVLQQVAGTPMERAIGSIPMRTLLDPETVLAVVCEALSVKDAKELTDAQIETWLSSYSRGEFDRRPFNELEKLTVKELTSALCGKKGDVYFDASEPSATARELMFIVAWKQALKRNPRLAPQVSGEFEYVAVDILCSRLYPPVFKDKVTRMASLKPKSKRTMEWLKTTLAHNDLRAFIELWQEGLLVTTVGDGKISQGAGSGVGDGSSVEAGEVACDERDESAVIDRAEETEAAVTPARGDVRERRDEVKCWFCKQGHRLRDCPTVTEEQREEVVAKHHRRGERDAVRAVGDTTHGTIQLTATVSAKMVLDSGATRSVMPRSVVTRMQADPKVWATVKYAQLRFPLEMTTADGSTCLRATHRLETAADIHIGGAVAGFKGLEFYVVTSDRQHVVVGEPMMAQLGIPTMQELARKALKTRGSAPTVAREAVVAETAAPRDADESAPATERVAAEAARSQSVTTPAATAAAASVVATAVVRFSATQSQHVWTEPDPSGSPSASSASTSTSEDPEHDQVSFMTSATSATRVRARGLPTEAATEAMVAESIARAAVASAATTERACPVTTRSRASTTPAATAAAASVVVATVVESSTSTATSPVECTTPTATPGTASAVQGEQMEQCKVATSGAVSAASEQMRSSVSERADSRQRSCKCAELREAVLSSGSVGDDVLVAQAKATRQSTLQCHRARPQ